MNATNLKSVLNNYLSHIIYLDDQFKIFWERTGRTTISKTPQKKPARKRASNNKTEAHTTDTLQMKKDRTFEGKELYNFCLAAQTDFSNLTITPLIYDEKYDQDEDKRLELNEKLKTAKLIVIDGNLSDNYHAIDVVEELKNSEELKLVVVYTAQKIETIGKFNDKNYELRDRTFKNAQGRDVTYNYAITDDFSLMICEKREFNFNDIVNAYTELFLKFYGYFPIGFIDMINTIEQKNSKYLFKFSKPFDSLMFLQTQAEGLPLEDVGDSLKNMLINNIRQDIELNTNILKKIYEEELNEISKSLDKDNFEIILKNTLDDILRKSGCNNKISNVFKKEIEIDTYKELMKKVVESKEDMSKTISNVSKELTKIYVDKRIEALKNSEPQYKDLPDSFFKDAKSVRESEISSLRNIIPIFLTMFVNKRKNLGEDSKIANLLTTLKINRYEDKSHGFSDIFNDCFDESYMLKKEHESEVINKLFSGDVFFKEVGDKKEVLLCMTPSCHMLRPKKVDHVIQFVRGVCCDKYPVEKFLRDSDHVSLLPDPNNSNKIIIVKWHLHDTVSLDLKHIDESWFKAIRPYKIIDDYYKQIVSEFNSFYSKIGVERLFLKTDRTVAKIILSED